MNDYIGPAVEIPWLSALVALVGIALLVHGLWLWRRPHYVVTTTPAVGDTISYGSTRSIDTTGASLLFATMQWTGKRANAPAITDNKGRTWTVTKKVTRISPWWRVWRRTYTVTAYAKDTP